MLHLSPAQNQPTPSLRCTVAISSAGNHQCQPWYQPQLWVSAYKESDRCCPSKPKDTDTTIGEPICSNESAYSVSPQQGDCLLTYLLKTHASFLSAGPVSFQSQVNFKKLLL